MAAPYAFIPPYVENQLLKYYEIESKNSFISTKFDSQQSSINYLAEIRTSRTAKVVSYERSNQPKTSPIEIWDYSKGPSLALSNQRSWPFNLFSEDNAKKCYDNMKIIDQFSRNVFSQYPVDNESKLMRSYIHVPFAYNNAFWARERQSVFFGDVDPDIFNPFINNLDVTAHEFGHAVTNFTSDLNYQGQSGALNEAISDIIAIQVKHFVNKTMANSPDANWLIGDGLIKNDTENRALRSLKDPGSAYNNIRLGKDPQCKHMSGYINTTNDNGGVHLNSGIPNHVFYLAATGIGGYAWEKTGLIWHNTLLQADKNDDFSTFASRTLDITNQLQYGDGIYQIVAKAWTDVGVTFKNTPTSSSRNHTLIKSANPLAYQRGNSASDRDRLALIISLLPSVYLLALASYECYQFGAYNGNQDARRYNDCLQHCNNPDVAGWDGYKETWRNCVDSYFNRLKH